MPASIQPSQAVDRCWSAYHQAFKDAVAAGTSKSQAEYPAEAAYRRAMPRLDTRDDIRAFIACVTDGTMFNIFYRDDIKNLLTAARIAASALPRETRAVGRPKTPSPKTNPSVPEKAIIPSRQVVPDCEIGSPIDFPRPR